MYCRLMALILVLRLTGLGLGSRGLANINEDYRHVTACLVPRAVCTMSHSYHVVHIIVMNESKHNKYIDGTSEFSHKSVRHEEYEENLFKKSI